MTLFDPESYSTSIPSTSHVLASLQPHEILSLYHEALSAQDEGVIELLLEQYPQSYLDSILEGDHLTVDPDLEKTFNGGLYL